MLSTEVLTEAGSQIAPAYEHAQVADAMRHGVITCPPATPLVIVARMMATHHVHAIVVTGTDPEGDSDPDEAAWGVVSAAGVASTDFACVTPGDTLAEASRRMLAHGTAHAVVVGARSRRPLGMVSSLDVAGVIAWGRC